MALVLHVMTFPAVSGLLPLALIVRDSPMIPPNCL